jgi:hypothetical protein
MAVDLITITATASGSAGSATGETTSSTEAIGKVLAVYVDEGAAATTIDITLAMSGTPNENILNLTDVTADAWYYPRKQVCENDGTALTYDGTRKVCEPYVVHDTLKLSLAQANDGDSVTVYVYIRT